MDGSELAGRFSYITNKLGYCGPSKSCDVFHRYIASKTKGKTNSKVIENLKKFEGLFPYLSTIADKHKKNFYDFEVVEAYWIGNKLLDGFSDVEMKSIIRKLMQRGLPPSVGNKLIKKLPKGFVPHHNFNVFYVGVGQTTGSVPTTVQNMDNCRISCGKIVGIQGSTLFVNTDVVKHENGIYFFKENETKSIIFDNKMINPVKGDNVAIHWGFAAMKLSDSQLSNLKKYSKRVLDVLNQRRH